MKCMQKKTKEMQANEWSEAKAVYIDQEISAELMRYS